MFVNGKILLLFKKVKGASAYKSKTSFLVSRQIRWILRCYTEMDMAWLDF